jgi:hypothetical protein
MLAESRRVKILQDRAMSFKAYCLLLESPDDAKYLFELLDAADGVGWLSGVVRSLRAHKVEFGVQGRPTEIDDDGFVDIPEGAVMANVTLDRGDLTEAIYDEFGISDDWSPWAWRLGQLDTRIVQAPESKLRAGYEALLKDEDPTTSRLSFDDYVSRYGQASQLVHFEYLDLPDGAEEWTEAEVARLIQ